MKREEATYGQLDRVLRLLGFSCRELTDEPPARVYEHKETGAAFVLPAFPLTDHVVHYHLLGVRTSLDLYGIIDPDKFDAKLTKAG